MEIGKQIRKYRTEQNLSQDDLADKVYVTRQTISNWENDRNYPDIRSLVLLSSVFGISLDILVKGDLEQMKEEIKTEDIRKFKHYNHVLYALMAGMVILSIPLLKYLKEWGIAISGLWCAVTLWWSYRVEKLMKEHDIHTYKEIVAFMDGQRLDEMEKNQEIGKRPYQRFLLCVASFLIGLATAFLLRTILF